MVMAEAEQKQVLNLDVEMYKLRKAMDLIIQNFENLTGVLIQKIKEQQSEIESFKNSKPSSDIKPPNDGVRESGSLARMSPPDQTTDIK